MTAPHVGGSTGLAALFEPAAVALVGASPDFARYGGRVLRFLDDFGFAGPIWPVNPKYDEIGGRPCYPDLKTLPGRPDHVGIAVAPERVPQIIETCADLGVGAVTVFSAGYAEQGDDAGRIRQTELAELARAAGIRLLGPNCNGIINWKRRLAMSATAAVMEPAGRAGCVGVVSHSGGLGQISVMWRALRAGLGISYQASCGNEADVDVLDVVDFLIDDPDTRIVLMAVEAIRDGDKLRAVAARAVAARKPILMLKLGRSEHGRRAAASHTGILTGADDVHDAALAQLGILRVEDSQHLYQAAMLFQQRRPLAADGVAAVSVSGGCLAVVADEAERFGLSFPNYGPDTLAALSTEVPGFLAISNPTDLSVEVLGKADGMTRVLDAVAADPAIGVVLPVLTMTPQRDVDACVRFARQSAKPAAIIWTGGCTDAPTREDDHLIDGVPVFRDFDTALRATGLLIRHAAFLRAAAAGAAPLRPPGIDAEHARRAVAVADGAALTERASKQILAAYGLPVPRELLATSPDEAAAHCAVLAESAGRAVAMKIESPDIAHKSDVGGVRLGIADPADAASTFDTILAAARAAQAAARLNGVLVQEMVAPGIELILGATSDPTYGPVVALGLGGVHAEHLGRPVLRLPPLDPVMARAMIEALPGRPLLDETRGRPAADVGLLSDLIVRFSWLVADLADLIDEIDVNPLIVQSDSATAVDCIMVRRDHGSC